MTHPWRILAVAAAFTLAGCAPESRCTDGIAELEAKLLRAEDTDVYKASPELLSQARGHLRAAQRQLESGAYEECVESLELTRALLNRAGRTN